MRELWRVLGRAGPARRGVEDGLLESPAAAGDSSVASIRDCLSCLRRFRGDPAWWPQLEGDTESGRGDDRVVLDARRG